MITVYTDGSSRGNPGPGGWGSIVVAGSRVRELGGREEKTTNNRMELKAAIESLAYLGTLGAHESPITLYSDSGYVINGITKWVDGWIRNNWQTKGKQPVLNRDLWEELVRVSEPFSVEWSLLPGHSGIRGNERCDEIATLFADNKKPYLYEGNLEEYSIPAKELLSPSRVGVEKNRGSSKAHSYLSLVDGKPVRHSEWDACKRRVEGKPHVKYRKALSPAHEEEILGEWGVDIRDVVNEK